MVMSGRASGLAMAISNTAFFTSVSGSAQHGFPGAVGGTGLIMIGVMVIGVCLRWSFVVAAPLVLGFIWQWGGAGGVWEGFCSGHIVESIPTLLVRSKVGHGSVVANYIFGVSGIQGFIV